MSDLETEFELEMEGDEESASSYERSDDLEVCPARKQRPTKSSKISTMKGPNMPTGCLSFHSGNSNQSPSSTQKCSRF